MYKFLIILTSILCVGEATTYAMGTDAESCVVIEADTRQILYFDNAREKLGIASTTKIMTAVLALENADLDEVITVSENAQNQEGSLIYLRSGNKITIENLLYGLMLNSGNDAAVAIAEGVGGDTESFVDMMNEKAAELGCRNTHFANPNGLPDLDHYSTAYDMALIMSYAMENEQFRKISSTKEYQIKMPESVTYLKNHNKLLWRSDMCIGGKTGFTKASGRCLVSCAEKDGKKIVVVTLNDRNDWLDHVSLYDYAFSCLENTKIISENDIICTKKIHGTKINLLSKEDFLIPLYKGKKRNLSCKVHLYKNIDEIHVGTEIGYADVFFGKYKIGQIELVSGGEAKNKKIFFTGLNYILNSVLLD